MQVQSIRYRRKFRQVHRRKIVFRQAERTRTEGIGLDRIRSGFVISVVNRFYPIGIRKRQQIAQNALKSEAYLRGGYVTAYLQLALFVGEIHHF